jgi:hypothetical protein
MAQPKTTAPDVLGQAMLAITSAFGTLVAAGVSPLVAFVLPAAVAVAIFAVLRR